MSGPKVIDYQAIERELTEAARRRWQALSGRASAFERRCVELGHPECAVVVPPMSAASSDEMQRQCDAIEATMARAEAELSRLRLDDRTRDVFSGMEQLLADLERREQAGHSGSRETVSTPAAAAAPGPSFAERVARTLASLTEPDRELERAAQSVLGAQDADRARLLYADLVDRVTAANHAADVRAARLVEIAELRAQLEGLPDPEPIRALLDDAAEGADRGADVSVAVQQARTAVAAQQDAVAAAADREFVRGAVADSLAELGYDVADVAVETADTLVYRQSSSHGLRARIDNGELRLHAVRLGSTTPPDGSDRDADEELCRRLPQLLEAMARRGVAADVTHDTLPGLVTPETVALRGTRTTSAPAAEQRPSTASRTRTRR